ncbi:MAG: hypothetical protein K0R43_2305 [Pseudoduganella sp.]|nr:hypothetical protein [Pseudoduganella sp.]
MDKPIKLNETPSCAPQLPGLPSLFGRVTEAKVKSGKSTYTVKPNTPAGSALPGDAAGSANRGPQWTVLEFDLLAKKKKRSAEEADKEDGPPPPPPAQPAAPATK